MKRFILCKNLFTPSCFRSFSWNCFKIALKVFSFFLLLSPFPLIGQGTFLWNRKSWTPPAQLFFIIKLLSLLYSSTAQPQRPIYLGAWHPRSNSNNAITKILRQFHERRDFISLIPWRQTKSNWNHLMAVWLTYRIQYRQIDRQHMVVSMVMQSKRWLSRNIMYSYEIISDRSEVPTYWALGLFRGNRERERGRPREPIMRWIED